MASNDHKSAADIEREVEMQRHRVSDTIDELQTRLSPGQLVDQVMSYGKGGAGEMAQNLGRAVMDNPIPAALLGVSLFWLMTGRNPASGLMGGDHHEKRVSADAARYHPPYYDSGEPYNKDHEGMGDKLKSAAGGARDFASGVAHKAGDAAHAAGEFGSNVRHKVSDAAAMAGDAIGHAKDAVRGAGAQMSHARDQVGGGMSSARHAIGDGYGSARDTIGGGYSSARDAMGSGYSQARGAYDDARHRVSGLAGNLSHRAEDLRSQASMMQENTMAFLSEQPLVAAALAFAAGAALGATLPVTRKENELMGDAADQVKAGLRDAAQPLMDRAQEVMGDVVSEGQSVIGEVVEEGRHVVDDAMKEGKSALDHAQSKLGESYGHMKDTVTDSVDKTLKTAESGKGDGAGKNASGKSSQTSSSGVPPTSDWPVGSSSGTSPGSTT